MKRLLAGAAVAGAFFLMPDPAHAQPQNQQQRAQSQGPTGPAPPVTQESQSMQELRAAAQRLREAVQAMAQQPAGERRNQAMAQAREALLRTQQAMLRLSPELRNSEGYREAQQCGEETQRALQGDQPNQQQAQQGADRIVVLVQAFEVKPLSEMRHASRLLNANLVGSNDSDVGKIEDLVMDDDWRVRGAVVEWGGFLGLGERRAVVPIERISLPARDSDRARLNMTREQLEQLAGYDRSRVADYGREQGWGDGVRLHR